MILTQRSASKAYSSFSSWLGKPRSLLSRRSDTPAVNCSRVRESGSGRPNSFASSRRDTGRYDSWVVMGALLVARASASSSLTRFAKDPSHWPNARTRPCRLSAVRPFSATYTRHYMSFTLTPVPSNSPHEARKRACNDPLTPSSVVPPIHCSERRVEPAPSA